MWVYSGQPLVRNGLLAVDPACCCCCCWELDKGTPPAKLLGRILQPLCPLVHGVTFELNWLQGFCDTRIWRANLVDIGFCPAQVFVNWEFACRSRVRGCCGYTLTMTPASSGCIQGPQCYEPIGACQCNPLFVEFCGYILQDNIFVPPGTDQCQCCDLPFCVVIWCESFGLDPPVP